LAKVPPLKNIFFSGAIFDCDSEESHDSSETPLKFLFISEKKDTVKKY